MCRWPIKLLFNGQKELFSCSNGITVWTHVLYVRLNNVYDRIGVMRQGGVLSLVLFAIYTWLFWLTDLGGLDMDVTC